MESTNEMTIYNIGDIGPAGGYIFECIPDYENDCTLYFEAAPSDLRVVNGIPTVDSSIEGYDDADPVFCFGFPGYRGKGVLRLVNGTKNYDTTNCTLNGIGTGKQNTKLIVDAYGDEAYSIHNESGKTPFYAARLCSILEHNGYSDWFLPSKDELDLMFSNLYMQGIGNMATVGGYFFNQGKTYWSSSECGNVSHVYVRDFELGFQAFSSRANKFCVRPARAFAIRGAASSGKPTESYPIGRFLESLDENMELMETIHHPIRHTTNEQNWRVYRNSVSSFYNSDFREKKRIIAVDTISLSRAYATAVALLSEVEDNVPYSFELYYLDIREKTASRLIVTNTSRIYAISLLDKIFNHDYSGDRQYKGLPLSIHRMFSILDAKVVLDDLVDDSTLCINDKYADTIICSTDTKDELTINSSSFRKLVSSVIKDSTGSTEWIIGKRLSILQLQREFEFICKDLLKGPVEYGKISVEIPYSFLEAAVLHFQRFL